MKTHNKKYDVLVVGCGPSGATLANLLKNRGHSVAIFERDKEIFHAPRAMALDPQSCRIYHELGVLQKMIPKDATPWLDGYFLNANREELLHLDLRTMPKYEGQYAYMFHQPALEAYLREDLEHSNQVDTFYGYEVVDIDGEGDSASLVAVNLETNEKITYSGKFIVGSDGGRSMCRKAIESKIVDLNYKKAWIVIDMIVQDQALWDAQRMAPEMICAPDAAVVWVKGHNNHFRLDFEVGENAKEFTREDAIKLISTFIDPSSIKIIRQIPYYFYAGMPDQWRKGRVVLMGDAAHSTPPFGGQGLNMGVRDATNLAFKLDLILKGITNSDFLDTYQEEFWDFYATLIKESSKTGRTISLTNPIAIGLRNLTYWVLNRSKFLMYHLFIKNSAIGGGFKQGFIGKHKIAGDRCFQPMVKNKDGASCGLDTLQGAEFALITNQEFSGATQEWFTSTMNGKVLQIGKDFKDSTNELGKWMKQHQVNSVLVRPDKYIFEAGNNPNELCTLLQKKLALYKSTIVKEANLI